MLLRALTPSFEEIIKSGQLVLSDVKVKDSSMTLKFVNNTDLKYITIKINNYKVITGSPDDIVFGDESTILSALQLINVNKIYHNTYAIAAQVVMMHNNNKITVVSEV